MEKRDQHWREKKSVSAVFRFEIRRLWTDEEGMVFALLVVIFLGLAIICFGVAGIGNSIREKVEMQNAVDAAAYSGAVIQADIYSACAQLNQAIAYNYAGFLNASTDYITAKWLVEARKTALEMKNRARRNATIACANCAWYCKVTFPHTRDIVTKSCDEFLGLTDAAPGTVGDAEGKIKKYREAIVALSELELELQEESADMVRAEVHDVLRKNLDIPSLLSEDAEKECFFSCDLDVGGEDHENWFEKIIPSASLDPVWQHISGDKYDAEFLDKGTIRAIGDIGANYFTPENDYVWFPVRMGDFPGHYDARYEGDYYLRARIKYGWRQPHIWYDEHGCHYNCGGWIRQHVDVNASDVEDAYFNPRDNYFSDNEFTWYRRPKAYFRYGSINVGAVRKMRNLLGSFGGGSSIFRVFDPSFWLGGRSRYMMAAASSRAGYRDGTGRGRYNPTGDAASFYPVPSAEEDAWVRNGWSMTSHNGFTLDWDAVLMPLNRARSWRVPGVDAGSDGEWEDEEGIGSGHDVLMRLRNAKWYEAAAEVTLDESQLPYRDGLENIEGMAFDFPVAPGWTQASRDALPGPGDASVSVENWPGNTPTDAIDFGDAEKVFELIKH